MQCEKCKKKKATLYYNENINGQRRSFHLCADCASVLESAGELEDMSIFFPDFDFSLGLWDAVFTGLSPISPSHVPNDDPPDRACPSCGSTFREIAASGFVGCPQCYEVFATALYPIIHSLHGHHAHTGSLPRTHRHRIQRQARLDKLKEQLREAIATEAYEQAAVLRDELHRLEAES